MTTKISIVTAYYQLEDMTTDFLNNLSQTLLYDAEVILVNAGSKRIDHPIVSKRIDLPVNKSFSNSMNAGIKEATGEYVCVIGNDVFPDKLWLRRLMKAATTTNAYITSPINDKTEMKNYKTKPIAGDLLEAEFFPAVCWLISRECIDKVGLFDEDFEIGTYEDNDYMDRVHDAGGKLVLVSNVVVKHLESQTVKLLGDYNDILAHNARIYNQKHRVR